MNAKTYSIYKFTKDIKGKFFSLYNNYWNDYRERTLRHGRGKLVTYFSFKTSFRFEEYLKIKSFKHRQAICKIRISAHPQKIETDRYSKKEIERSSRKMSIL